MAKPTVALIPWDPDSVEHVERMVEQRRSCGWHAPLVTTEWINKHLTGKKCMYWITFPQDEPQCVKYNKIHMEAYPKESEELVDSSKTIRGNARIPTATTFLPVGHIALDTHDPAYAEKLGLIIPEFDSYWIKNFYVSYVLQGLGIGGAAMNITELMATEEPLNARHLLLDTVHHVDQSNKEYTMAFQKGQFKIPTQAWYERRGYRLIGTVQNLYNDPDPTGKIWPSRAVFLQKDIAET